MLFIWKRTQTSVLFYFYDKREAFVTIVYHLSSFYSEKKSLWLIDAKPKGYYHCIHAIFNLGVAFVLASPSSSSLGMARASSTLRSLIRRFSPWQSSNKFGSAHLAYRKRSGFGGCSFHCSTNRLQPFSMCLATRRYTAAV